MERAISEQGQLSCAAALHAPLNIIVITETWFQNQKVTCVIGEIKFSLSGYGIVRGPSRKAVAIFTQEGMDVKVIKNSFSFTTFELMDLKFHTDLS